MDSDTGTQSPATEPPTAKAKAKTTPFSGREDCWSADATSTLIEAWGERYLDLNRGNLRQKHWQEVADAVNSEHSDGGGKSRRTDVQCKNRIDTLKKKYKIEKARVSDCGGSYSSPWPFFSRLDDLIGSTFPLAKRLPSSSPPPPPPPQQQQSGGASNRDPSPPSWARHSPVPVGPRSSTQKRPAPLAGDYSGSGRSFFAFAAAVAAMEDKADEGEDEAQSGRSRSSASGSRLRLSRGRTRDGEGEKAAPAGTLVGELAEAIERFGEIYERVEQAKQRQMLELEKQRMQFTKDLEYQRMRLFMDTQVHIQKIKRTKRSSASAADNYS